jgi:hypothetical protein
MGSARMMALELFTMNKNTEVVFDLPISHVQATKQSGMK